MGIQGLMKLICDYAPACVKDHAIKNYFGKVPIFCVFIEVPVHVFLIEVQPRQKCTLISLLVAAMWMCTDRKHEIRVLNIVPLTV